MGESGWRERDCFDYAEMEFLNDRKIGKQNIQ
jgi:hypothetical protein